MENLDIYFKKVEEVLKTFPEECQRNYYQNKQTLKIEFKPPINKHTKGEYDHDNNIITIYHEDSIYHELFHMAFRDKDKVGKKLFQNNMNVYYGNGVSYELHYSHQKKRSAEGLTEGFAQYLSKKCHDIKFQHLEYFFINLLILIHGEEIINYALKNDPVGFFENKKIYNIHDFSKRLDNIRSNENNMMCILTCKESFEKIISEGTHEERMEICQILSEIRREYKKSIIKLFELIILEYKKCKNPQIDKSNFIELLKSFITESDYQKAFVFDDEKYSVKEELTKLISKLEKNKIRKLIRKN